MNQWAVADSVVAPRYVVVQRLDAELRRQRDLADDLADEDRHLEAVTAVADGVRHADIVVPGPDDAEPQRDAGHAGFAYIFVRDAPGQAKRHVGAAFLFIVRERAAGFHHRPPDPAVHRHRVANAVVGGEPGRALLEVAERQRPACRPVRAAVEMSGFLGNLDDCEGARLGNGEPGRALGGKPAWQRE